MAAFAFLGLNGFPPGGSELPLDEEAAKNLRDVIRGFMALAKLQAGRKPEFQAMMQSLELGGTGKTVALTFSVPGEVFDALRHTPTPR